MRKASEWLNLLNMLHESDQFLLEAYTECRQVIGDRLRAHTAHLIEQEKLTSYESATLKAFMIRNEISRLQLSLHSAESSAKRQRAEELHKKGFDSSKIVPQAVEDDLLRLDRITKAVQSIRQYQQQFDKPTHG